MRPYEAVAPYPSYVDPRFPGYDPRSLGYVTGMAVPPEDLRRRQEEFSRAAELRQTLANLEKVDDEGRRSSLLDSLCLTEDVLNLPEHPSPPGIASGELRVDLLRHQVSDDSPAKERACTQLASALTEASVTVGD